MNWSKTTGTRFPDLESQFSLDRSDGMVRLTRSAQSRPLDDGTLVPDLALGGKLTLLAANGEDGAQALDSKGRQNVRAYITNPNEIVQTPEIASGASGRILDGAFSASIAEFNESPRMLAFHNMTQPIGNWTRVWEDAGLWGEGFISAARPDMQRLALDGVLEVSAGFWIDEALFNEDLELFDIVKTSLVEVSLLPFGRMRSAFLEVAAALALSSSDHKPDPSPVATVPDSPVTVFDFGPALSAALSSAVAASRTIAELQRTLGSTSAASGGREAE